jgi:4-hydroxybenzoyl-CoA thioesterase/acyl-CoA thioester hydrolase
VSTGFRYRRRVEFAETDQAGIAHFSVFFRYMEEAEHALWRAAGMSIAPHGQAGWARVAAAFDFKAPLRFEDECDIDVQIAEVSRRKVRYAFTFQHGDRLVGSGTMTTVPVKKAADGTLSSYDVPMDVVERLGRVIEGVPRVPEVPEVP